MKILDWNNYFMIQAVVASARSKDPATKVGCYIADKNNHPIATGYNGFPAGIDETKFTWAKDKSLPYHQTKYAFVHHAEENAILHSEKNLEGSRMYVTLFPCNACARMIVTKKISEVFYIDDKNINSEEGIASQIILNSGGVKITRMKLDSQDILKTMSDLLNALKMD
jgi:dCMP deaminase